MRDNRIDTDTIALLKWHDPVELTVTRQGSIRISANDAEIPETRGMYVFARRRREGVTPVYIGLASRHIRQRFEQHLKDAATVRKLVATAPGKLVFLYANLEPGDLEFSKRYLPSIERALIHHAVMSGAALVNVHQKMAKAKHSTETCAFKNDGHNKWLSAWWPTTVATELLPPRAPAARTPVAGRAR